MKRLYNGLALLCACFLLTVDGVPVNTERQEKPNPFNDEVEQELAGLTAPVVSENGGADPLADEFGYSPEALEMIQYLITRIEQSVERKVKNVAAQPQQPVALPTDIQAEVPTDLHAEIPTDLHAKLPTDIQAEVPTDLHAKLPTDIQAELPIDLSADLPSDLLADNVVAQGADQAEPEKKDVQNQLTPARYPVADADKEMPRFKSAQEAFDEALLEAMKSMHMSPSEEVAAEEKRSHNPAKASRRK